METAMNVAMSKAIHAKGDGFTLEFTKAASLQTKQNRWGCAKSEIILVTPAWAAKHLEDWHYPLQRNLSPANIQRLSYEMEMGRFVPGTQMFVCQTPDRKNYLVNAQHTLSSVVKTGINIELTLTTLFVPDIEAVGKVYASFDLQKVRSFAASWKAFKGSDGTALEIKALSGIAIIKSDFSISKVSGSISREDRLLYLEEYIGAGVLNTLETAFQGGMTGISKYIKRSGIISIALYTALHQPSVAREFWNLVVTEGHPETNHPTRALARHLVTATGGGSKFQQEDIDKAALAWNAAWAGRKAAYFKPEAVKTFKILGTPWHNGAPEA